MAEKDNTPKESFKPNFNPIKGKKPKFSFYWIYGVLLLGFLGLQVFNYNNPVNDSIQFDIAMHHNCFTSSILLYIATQHMVFINKFKINKVPFFIVLHIC